MDQILIEVAKGSPAAVAVVVVVIIFVKMMKISSHVQEIVITLILILFY